MTAPPVASIIVSAYNRPTIIKYAINSVLYSDFDNWELIIVGDGCNSETEESINSFPDSRIKFYNLPRNTGHQSAPHNKGVEMANGEYIFFLNQDDMYFPNHLSARIDFMRSTSADISWSPILLVQQSGLDEGPIDAERDRLVLDGAVPDGMFDPRSFVISSCWAVRRDVCGKVGNWLPVEKTRLSPSQEWLYRAYKQNRRMIYHPYVSVLCIHSGTRRYSYVSTQSIEHERAWNWITSGPEERLRLLNCVAVQMAGDLFEARNAVAKQKRPLLATAQSVARKIGIHPDSIQRFFDGLSKGSWVSNHTKFTRSAPPVISLYQTVLARFANQVRHRVYPGSPWEHIMITSHLKTAVSCSA